MYEMFWDHKSKDCAIANVDQYKCVNCQLNHSSNSKDCPVYSKINNQKNNPFQRRRINQNTPGVDGASKIFNDILNNKINLNSRPGMKTYREAVIQPKVNSASDNDNKQEEGFSSLTGILNDLKFLFSNFNVTKIISTFKNTLNKIINCNDNFTRITCLIEGLLEIFI